MYTKTFTNKKRFLAEVMNYNLFNRAGFSVPNRLHISSVKMCVIYEKILGTPAQACHIDEVITLVVRTQLIIAKQLNLHSFSEFILQNYLREINFILLQNKILGDVISELIRKHFFPSLFRDAKPENWIFSVDGSFYMIDFDYLVPSGPLQDVAQFLTGIWINNSNFTDETILFEGVNRLLTNEPWMNSFACSQEDIYKIFAAASLLSVSKKKQYSKYYIKKNRLQKLEKMIVYYLKENQY